MNFDAAYQFAVKLLTDELPEFLAYHDVQHTKSVVREVDRIGKMEGLSDADLCIVKTAAAFHDTGFVKEYFRNEPIGAKIAGANLTDFDYSQDEIKQIQSLILETSFPPKPKDDLSRIICDADLSYVGTSHFKRIAAGLKKEFFHVGLIAKEEEWLKLQVTFLKNLKFHTATGKKLYNNDYRENLLEAEQDYARYMKTHSQP